MRLLILLTVIAVVLVGLAEANVFSNSLSLDAVEYLRAGARKPTNNKPYGSSRSSKRSKSGKSASKQSRWGSKPKKSKGVNFKAKLEKLAKQGQLVYKDVYRRAKVLRSSAFESMLLKATWPSNDPVQPDILGEIIKYSIPAFKYTGTQDGEDDPYYMTLHKLWTKMSESDWRTVTKSLYILHTIMRDCQVDACAKFSAAVRDMSKTYNPKNPEHKYFSVSTVASQLADTSSSSGSSSDVSHQSFVTAYMQYVVYRTKFLPARFESIKRMSTTTTTEKKALTALKKLQQAITFGLEVEVFDKEDANAITGYVAKQVANDLRELYVLLGEKIKPLLVSANGSTGVDVVYSKYSEARSIHKADILKLLQFYQSTGDKIKVYLEHNAKLYSRLRIKISTDLDKKSAPSTEAVAQRIRELVPDAGRNLTGGAIATTSSSGSTISRGSGSTSSSMNEKELHNTKESGLKRRLLHRADRPLTPEEVQLSAELAGKKVLKAKTLPLQPECHNGVCSMSRVGYGAETVARSGEVLEGTRGGAQGRSSSGRTEDDDDEDDYCDEEECSGEEDEEEDCEEEEEVESDEEDEGEGDEMEEDEDTAEGADQEEDTGNEEDGEEEQEEEDEVEGSDYDDQELEEEMEEEDELEEADEEDIDMD